LAHAPRLLAGDDPVQCTRLRRLDRLERCRVVGRRPPSAAQVLDHQVASQARDEAVQPRCVSKLAAANLLQCNSKGLLVQVVHGGRVRSGVRRMTLTPRLKRSISSRSAPASPPRIRSGSDGKLCFEALGLLTGRVRYYPKLFQAMSTRVAPQRIGKPTRSERIFPL